MQHLYKELEQLLQQDECFVLDDRGMAKNVVLEAPLKLDEKLITLLLGHDRLKDCILGDCK